MSDENNEDQADKEEVKTEAEPEVKAEAEDESKLELDELEGTGTEEVAMEGPDDPDAGLEAVYDIPVKVSAVLGTTNLQIHQLLKLGRGAVIELDRKVGEAVDILVNDRLVARGEVVIVEDKLGITMTEIVKSR